MGGLLVYHFSARYPGLFDGVVALSPAFKNKMHFSWFSYLKLFFGLLFCPKLQIKLPFKSDELTHDKSYKDKLNDDSLEVRVATVRLLFNILLAEFSAVRLAAAVTDPLFFLLAGEDYLVSTDVSRVIFKKTGSVHKKLNVYEKMYHALSIDEQRECVFADIYDWITI